jgi:hypothetical protein
MAKIKNVSPLGDVYIPSLGLTVNANSTFDVADATVAASLLEQTSNWAAADQAAAAVVTPASTPNPETPAADAAPAN